jgi:VanZ like family
MPPQRYALATLIAAGLILYGGLFPFKGWTSADPLALFRGATAYRMIRDDIFVNIVVFLPFGFCAWRALPRKYAAWKSLLLTASLGLSVSLAIEIFQAFLPSRKSSLADVVCNFSGALAGGLVAWRTPLSRYLRISQDTGLLVIAIALWTLTLLTPAAMITWFGVHASRIAHQPDQALRLDSLFASGLYTFGLLASTMAFSNTPVRMLRNALMYFTGIFLLSIHAGPPPLMLESVTGAALAFGCAYHFRQSPAQRMAILAFWALAIAFIASESLPGDRPVYRSFNWIPFRGHLAHPLIGIESLAQIIWPVIAAACVLRRALPWLGRHAGTIAGVVFLAIAGLALEYSQTQLPGRLGDVTIPLLMVFTWFACWSIQFSQTSLPLQRNGPQNH